MGTLFGYLGPMECPTLGLICARFQNVLVACWLYTFCFPRFAQHRFKDYLHRFESHSRVVANNLRAFWKRFLNVKKCLGNSVAVWLGRLVGILGTPLGVLEASWGRPGSSLAVHLQIFSRNIELHWQRNRTNICMFLIEGE